MTLRSYTSSYTLGHNQVKDIFEGHAVITEKVDGSQFSMGVVDGQLYCRSKRHMIDIDNPVELFDKAVETAKRLAPKLRPGWVYRCEYLKEPQHNTLKYNRVPREHLVIFDIDVGIETYLLPDAIHDEADWLGLEAVPVIFHGPVRSVEQFKDYLQRESFLGGCLIEGVAIKNYQRMTAEKKIMLATYVSPEFKEANNERWRQIRAGQTDIVNQLIDRYTTEARWRKSVQHLAEAGELDHSPKDISRLLGEIQEDILLDSSDEIREALFQWAWPRIRRGVTRGFPEWYKEQLLERQFENVNAG